jgi:hypothetical protein
VKIMRTLRNAAQAAKSLGYILGGPQQQHADVIADAFDALGDRLIAIEEILRTLAQRAAVSADDAVKTGTDRRVEGEIRRILG